MVEKALLAINPIIIWTLEKSTSAPRKDPGNYFYFLTNLNFSTHHKNVKLANVHGWRDISNRPGNISGHFKLPGTSTAGGAGGLRDCLTEDNRDHMRRTEYTVVRRAIIREYVARNSLSEKTIWS